MSDQKVLVTGASGFVGSHLCHRLLAAGCEVHGLSRRRSPNTRTDFRWWRGDLSEIQTVRKLLLAIQPDIIFHLASHVSGSRERDLVLPTFQCNLASSVNLLTVATEICCRRFVLAGSLEESFDDHSSAVPVSPYAAAKTAASAYARMFHALYETPVAIARLFMVYGPGQQDLTKLIPYVIRSVLRGEQPQLSSGERPVDWIYVEDVVQGLLDLAITPNIEGSTIDLGSGNLVLIRDVVECLLKRMDKAIQPVLGALKDRPREQVKAADIDATFDRIGWRPETSLSEGLQSTIDWYTRRFERHDPRH